MKTYNVGFIGFGFIGKVQAYAYRNLSLFYDPVPLQARITHVCTSRRETAEAGAALVGAERAVTDYRQVTEESDVDIVHICTPNHLHRAALLSAMAHGKHIYCDKPLVATEAEAEEIEAALPAYKATAQMGFQNRFFPATLRARQLVEEGFLGDVLEFRAAFLHGGSADPEAPLKWKLSAAAGRGVIADLASHVLDIVHHLLGDYETLAAASHIAYLRRPSPDDPSRLLDVDAEDCVMVLARMRSGALGTIEGTKLATGTEDELRFEIHGSRIDTGQRYPEPATGFPSPKVSIGWLRGHIASIDHFLEAVRDGGPGDPGLAQGIYVQRLMERVRQSAETGQWVTV